MQILSVGARLRYRFASPTDCLFQIELAEAAGQTVRTGKLRYPKGSTLRRLTGEDGIGTRFWLRCDGEVEVRYTAEVAIERAEPDFDRLTILAPSELAAGTVRYLMSSRYCEIGLFQKFVADEFGAAEGGDKVRVMIDWIADKMDYVPGASNAETTAVESFVKRSGVCRDYAHLIISFARAAGIPARMASLYAPRVDPQDFHAVAQLFLADEDGRGDWYFVDPTDMARAGEIGLIGVGRDAADISFMTSYGVAEMVDQEISVECVG